MIIRVIIDNFLSFNEEVELLLTPGKSRNLKGHIIKATKRQDVSILKSAVIYGANASGKSNLTKTLFFLKKMVTEQSSRKIISYEKFKLDAKSKDRHSRIEIEFHYKGNNYGYGIVFDRQVIHEEWLYLFDKKNDRKIYDRKTRNGKIEMSFDNLGLSKKNLERLTYIGADTLPNELFLNASNHRNIADIEGISHLTNAFKWFDDALTVIFPESKFIGLEVNIDSDIDMREVYQWFLSKFNTGISGLETINVDFFSPEVDLPEKLKRQIAEDLDVGERAMISSIDNITYSLFRREGGDIEAVKLMTKHKVKNSNSIKLFEINEESDGTQRIMDFIPAIVELAKKERVFVIDEINRSLHPKLTVKLFELFFAASTGVKSQLICTTHESQLLDQKKLRKDEVWFVKKNAYGESMLYSLEEFRERKDADIRTGYLKGRYDAVPNFSSMDDAPWKNN